MVRDSERAKVSWPETEMKKGQRAVIASASHNWQGKMTVQVGIGQLTRISVMVYQARLSLFTWCWAWAVAACLKPTATSRLWFPSRALLLTAQLSLNLSASTKPCLLEYWVSSYHQITDSKQVENRCLCHICILRPLCWILSWILQKVNSWETTPKAQILVVALIWGKLPN